VPSGGKSSSIAAFGSEWELPGVRAGRGSREGG